MPESTDQFYSNLPANQLALHKLLVRQELFQDLPADWHIIITDIKNSTAAVAGGLHETVNLIAAGSIVTVLNIAYKAGLTIPFFFGGDGATFIVPPLIIDRVIRGLQKFQANTLTNFNLELRVGTLPVKSVYDSGQELRISKFKSSAILSIPVVLGNGLSYAEKIIKGEDYLLAAIPAPEEELDLSGMQCRWDKISPPEDHFEVVTLLIIAGSAAQQSLAFSKVVSLLDQIYGTPEIRQPISVSKLRLKTTFSRIEMEMRAKIGQFQVFSMVYNWFTYLLGYLYFTTQKGKDYLVRLVNLSDTLVIDGRINTVISGTEKQRLTLEHALNEMEKAGEIKFGLCVSKESVMSCYVRDLQDDHIHFVDGADGGYTNAAGMLKIKIRGS
jgi:hypothetical protein